MHNFFSLRFPLHECFFLYFVPRFHNFSNSIKIHSLRPLFKSERREYHYPSENNIYFFLFFINNSHNSLAEPKVPHRAEEGGVKVYMRQAQMIIIQIYLSDMYRKNGTRIVWCLRFNFISFVSNSSCYNTYDEI